ncbi:MAG TPA: aldehyde dehydrogenase family protein [Vicinamibacteria bacterium]|nr:aldehyde dehydrogenase family protein [Vicinamibacteria bacterium]
MPLQAVNPYDQKVVAEVPLDDAESLAAKVVAARSAFARWSRLPLEERMRRVRAGLARFRERGDAIAREVTLQMGKPIGEARRELQTFCERAEHMLAIAPRTLAPEVLPEKDGLHRRIEHAPLGVVLDIAAWNYPLLIPVNVVVPALLAGNTVLLKHSARTPLCGQRFAQAFADPELPGVMASLELDHDRTARLLGDPRAVDYVAFTGSVAGGQAVYRQAARRVLDVGLELGGKDPAYVAADADLEFTVENVVDGACYNAGQSCCAVERAYVHRRVYDEFVERARTALRDYRLGDPLDEATTMGPLASRPALDTLEAQVDDAVRRGARLLLGGRRVPDTPGNFFPPTLLTGVPNEAEVMQEESFGPLLPVRAVADDDEALRLMNDTRYGLTASVWTRDRARADRFAGELRAGTVYQNRCDYLDPALPWTGVGDSGKGSTLSPWGFYHLTRRRSIHFRSRP